MTASILTVSWTAERAFRAATDAVPTPARAASRARLGSSTARAAPVSCSEISVKRLRWRSRWPAEGGGPAARVSPAQRQSAPSRLTSRRPRRERSRLGIQLLAAALRSLDGSARGLLGDLGRTQGLLGDVGGGARARHLGLGSRHQRGGTLEDPARQRLRRKRYALAVKLGAALGEPHAPRGHLLLLARKRLAARLERGCLLGEGLDLGLERANFSADEAQGLRGGRLLACLARLSRGEVLAFGSERVQCRLCVRRKRGLASTVLHH